MNISILLASSRQALLILNQ